MSKHYPKHMGALKLSGVTRLVLSIAAVVIVLPIVLYFYLNIGPGASAQDIWLAFAQTAPFGDELTSDIFALWGEAQSGLDSVLEYIMDPEPNFALHFSVELAQLIFGGLVIFLVSKVLEKAKILNVDGDFFDVLANAVSQLLLTFLASLLVDYVFRLFELASVDKEGILQSAIILGYILLLCGGFVAMLIALGTVFYFVLALAAIGCLKLCVSYCAFLWLLLAQMQGGSPIVTVIGIAVWLAAIWLLQTLEKVFLPHS